MNAKRRLDLAALLLAVIWCVHVARADTSVPTSVTVVVVPNTPSNLSAVSTSGNQVVLSWTDNASADEDGETIMRSTGNDLSFAPLATVGSGIATYTDDSVSPGTTYFYEVRSFIGTVYSAYSGEASVSTPASSGGGGSGGSGGGGGGGGGYSYGPPASQTSAVFRGIAYPSSNITLLENGQVAAVTQSGPDATFEMDLSGLAAGTYSFGIWASDPSGNRSLAQAFQITVTQGATTVVSGIFFPPTISADKTEVKQGDVLTVLGYAAPQVTVTVVVHSASPIVKNVTSSANGAWLYKIPTDVLAYGDHTVAVHAAAPDGNITTDSTLINFTVGDEDVAVPAVQSPTSTLIGDLNGDGRVNLIDFSIMAYWYDRANPPTIVDLNHDGTIDLADFSILAYYWTG